ncbi:hypothetical protein MCC93_26810 [Morococcus cerebrosus]|uniref:Uncharacterized protein n=1 Tax=Morococcus cerebrosus TaxID=1056807 RepID=A0A0C1GVK9_9NEIS|nr:hypothetical protein MCC93_26810 [Morococcus cerebrosus]
MTRSFGCGFFMHLIFERKNAQRSSENPTLIFRRPWIRISSATLGYQWLEQI